MALLALTGSKLLDAAIAYVLLVGGAIALAAILYFFFRAIKLI
jgi:Cytochrome B6-F complex subunit VI (PetL)